MKIDNSYGALIKRLREERGLPQKQLAGMLSVAQPHISRWENGEREISISMLKHIAKAFDLSLIDIIKIAEDEGTGD